MWRLASLPSMLLLVVVLLNACAPDVAIHAGSSIFRDLLAWVDAPQVGTVLTMPVEYTLDCNGTNLKGVQALEVSANGQALGIQTNPCSAAALYNASQHWVPSGPGAYTMTCRGQNGAGDLSGCADSNMKVVQDLVTITPTSQPTFTPTIAPTATNAPRVAGPSFTSRLSI